MKRANSFCGCPLKFGVFRGSLEATIAIILVVLIMEVFHVSTDDSIFHDTRQGDFSRSLASYEIVTPVRVHESGEHLSHLVSHSRTPETQRHRKPRAASGDLDPDLDRDAVHYSVTVDGAQLHLELFPNNRLFAPGLVVERMRGREGEGEEEEGEREGEGGTERSRGRGDSRAEFLSRNRCHFAGKVRGRPDSTVALATCDGLHGYIHTGQRDYFIEPVKNYNGSSSVGHPHLIYRRSALPPHLLPTLTHSTDTAHDTKKQGLCGVTDDQVTSPDERESDWETGRGNQRGRRRRQRRSISQERHVEALVVIDQSMMEYHRNDNIENYVLTIMNMVSTMYHDATIGNAVNVVLVRIIYLEQDEKDLHIQTHADLTLGSFCKWQNSINQRNDSHPNHHDVAILMTRLDICSRSTEPCSTLGLSQVSGLCQPHRSCNINQDTGLALAFTVAHELGHNFGMQHDTAENGCEPKVSGLQYIMAPQLTAEASPLVWSNCSRKAITSFFDRGWGHCLDDEPSDHEFEFPVLPPGVMYDIDHQCRLQYGPDAEFCQGIDDLCTAVWCRVDNKCLTRLEAAAEGTICRDGEWCFGGKCVAIGDKPLAIDSHWGEWGSWSECTRTCGAGVTHSERLCNNPPPSHGGRYCIGERKRYRICNTDACPEGGMSFREQQCAEFNKVLYKKSTYEWEPFTVITATATAPSSTECQLHCKPRGQYFSAVLRDVVADGTPCRSHSRDICISGRCRKVGCDWVIGSNATEDGCGICHGDGSTCKKITESFDKKSGFGYVDAIAIPEGARNILIEEVAQANNYLAIRNDKGEYYLNGDYYIQWSGDYELAGTLVEYRRDGNKERIFTRGPTTEPLHLMLLFQSQNPGIKLEYIVSNENVTEGRQLEYNWQYSDWTHCTASCGGGSQELQVVCAEKEAGPVDDVFCNATTRLNNRHKTCNVHQCPARWWNGPWQHCSISCGENGFHRRTVLCVRQRGPYEQIALEDSECDGLEKPQVTAHCKEMEPCPTEASPWRIGEWSEVCRRDPCSVQTRTVECTSSPENCNSSQMPPAERPCPHALCGQWQAREWSQCSQSCGGGVQVRGVVCISGRACSRDSEPVSQQACNTDRCDFSDRGNRTDAMMSDQTDFALKTADGSGVGNLSSNILEDSDDVTYYVNSSGVMDFGVKVPSTVSLPSTSVTKVPIAAAPGNDASDERVESFQWISLPWSECSKRCGHGYKNRKVQCINTRTKDIVFEDLCIDQNKPAVNTSCRREPCITWTVTAWQSCSAVCGEGVQERMVSCALTDLCDSDEKPPNRTVCDAGPCIRWTVGSWQACSPSCGNGVQHRNVTCRDVAAQQPSVACDETSKPPVTQSCNAGKCSSMAGADQCSSNFMNDGMCAMLRTQRRCSLAYVQRKCCKACQSSRLGSNSDGES